MRMLTFAYKVDGWVIAKAYASKFYLDYNNGSATISNMKNKTVFIHFLNEIFG